MDGGISFTRRQEFSLQSHQGKQERRRGFAWGAGQGQAGGAAGESRTRLGSHQGVVQEVFCRVWALELETCWLLCGCLCSLWSHKLPALTR